MPYALYRSIPACAGEPSSAMSTARRTEVYPRVCGGTMTTSCQTVYHTGLSPRVRGNRGGERRVAESIGSIPACAGEPRSNVRIQRIHRVYPRVCGGTPSYPGMCWIRRGLSPRVRGNRPASPSVGLRTRSIPACAGEPASCAARMATSTVYPRVCGGTVIEDGLHHPGNGLSPRVRGNPLNTPQGNPGLRSIPACAGEPRCRP